MNELVKIMEVFAGFDHTQPAKKPPMRKSSEQID